MTFRESRLRTALAVLVSILVVLGAGAQSPAERFADYRPGSRLEVDHSVWGDLLSRYLDDAHPSGVNRFDYAGVTAADRRRLRDYLEALESTDLAALDRDEQMAYWINFYNALTVEVILDHYPVDSIRDISLPGSRGGPWKAPLVRVGGADLSLDDIEHGILRPIWADPRIHYAVNCASIGCPNLAPRPYTAARLEAMLEAAARDYINHPRGVDADGRRIQISSIYKWYGEDFGDRDGLVAHLRRYADGDTAAALRDADGRFRYDYDWSLNELD